MSKDLRAYAGKTQARLIAGFILLVFLVGEGLIYLLYGKLPALMGLICLGGALVPVAAVLVIFWLLEKMLDQRE